MRENTIFYSIIVAVMAIILSKGNTKVSDIPSDGQSSMVWTGPADENIPVESPGPFQSSLDEQHKRFIGSKGYLSQLAVPVIWNEKTYHSLSAVAASMNDPNTAYIELHMNKGICGAKGYALAICSDRAVPLMKGVLDYWQKWTKSKTLLWTDDKYHIIRKANSKGTAVAIWEPVFADDHDPDAPLIVVESWPEFITEVALQAKHRGFERVMLYIGHENRDGGATWRGMSEEEFYTHIKNCTPEAIPHPPDRIPSWGYGIDRPKPSNTHRTNKSAP